MLKRVALFDFDNTVATGDSITRLLQYDMKKRPGHIFKFIKAGIYYILHLLHVLSFEQAKSALLFPLNSMDNEELEMFYQEHVAIYYYKHVVEEMKRKQEEGYIVILCTASCEAYMKYSTLPYTKLIGTRTQSFDNHSSSTVLGKNCKKEEKVSRILDYLKAENIEIDYENSYGYSDSNDDLPMLSLVKHKKRVLLKTGEIVDFKE